MQRNTSEAKIIEKIKCSEKRTMPCFSGLRPFCAGVDAPETCGASKIGLAHTHMPPRWCRTEAQTETIISVIWYIFVCQRVYDPRRKKRLRHTNPKERKMCQDQRFDKTHLGKCIRAQFSAKIYFNLNFVRTGLSIWSTLFAGGMAGICNWLVAIPMDVVKSRLQVRAVIIIMSVIMLTMMIRIRSCLAWQDWIQAAPEGTYTGAIDVLKQLLKNEGPVALYKGCVPILLRSISSSDEA